jgi:uncharacterized protein
MRILISGATGFIGTPLSEFLIRSGHELVILTRTLRRTASRSARVRHVVWSPENEKTIVEEVNESDAIINLAGESIAAKRWSAKQKEKILSSRVLATQILVQSIEKAKEKPRVLINGSAIGYYGPKGSETLDEAAPAGEGFLASTCKAWEAHALRAEDFGVRVVRLRIGVVLEKGGGALEKMLPPFQMFVGGWLGSGNQWMSWIHRADVIRLIDFCLTDDEMKGVVNATAPQPVTNKAFSLVLAQVIKRPCFMPVPPLALKVLLGEMADELLLTGQRVIPRKATDSGFTFQYPEIRHALEAVLKPKPKQETVKTA